ncbi:MAG TPA: hypothetical protein VF798_06590 [Burkholderiaceae bacterium]
MKIALFGAIFFSPFSLHICAAVWLLFPADCIAEFLRDVHLGATP